MRVYLIISHSLFKEKDGELEHQKRLNELDLQKAKELAEIEVCSIVFWHHFQSGHDSYQEHIYILVLIFKLDHYRRLTSLPPWWKP